MTARQCLQLERSTACSCCWSGTASRTAWASRRFFTCCSDRDPHASTGCAPNKAHLCMLQLSVITIAEGGIGHAFLDHCSLASRSSHSDCFQRSRRQVQALAAPRGECSHISHRCVPGVSGMHIQLKLIILQFTVYTSNCQYCQYQSLISVCDSLMKATSSGEQIIITAVSVHWPAMIIISFKWYKHFGHKRQKFKTLLNLFYQNDPLAHIKD